MKKGLNKVGEFVGFLFLLISVSLLFKPNFGFAPMDNPYWPARAVGTLIFYVVGVWFIVHTIKEFKKNKKTKETK